MMKVPLLSDQKSSGDSLVKVHVGDHSRTFSSGEQGGLSDVSSGSDFASRNVSKDSHFEVICDIVQFTTAIFYVEEDEEKMNVDIMRLGNLEESCRVKYQTEDASAKAGVKYHAAQGVLEFAPGEHTKKIEISVINDDKFDTTQEFKVLLKDPENCVLGRYLYICRVKIIDDDCFPTNRYKEKLLKKDIEDIPGMSLFWEFCKLIFSLSDMSSKTMVILAFDQMHNLYYLLTTYLLVYMVDVIFNFHSPDVEKYLLVPDSRQWTTIVVAMLYVVPFGLLHFWDYTKAKMDLPAQEWLQGALFRRYLNYSEESREEAPPSAIALAVIDEATEVVGNGYMRWFSISQNCGKLLIAMGFVIQQNWEAAIVVLTFFPALLIWITMRNKRFVEYGQEIARQKLKVVHTVHKACDNYRLIADYHQRPHMIQVFDRQLVVLSDAQGPLDLMVLNNSMFPYWLSTIATAGYILIFSGRVMDGTLSLGTFIAMINIFSSLGDNFQNTYDEIMGISGIIGPLQKIVKFMNLDTDLRQKKQVNRGRRSKTKEFTSVLMRKQSEGEQPSSPSSAIAREHYKCISDRIPIRLKGVRFTYDSLPEHFDRKGIDWLIKVDDLTANQGSITAVVGPHKGGKSTFLKLVSQLSFPQEGEIFIPTHLRVLNVSYEPIIMSMGLYHNLTFGDETADPGRVKRILTRLELHKLIGIIEQDMSQENDPGTEYLYIKSLSHTDACMIHLARAFIANPEVMVLHRPFNHFDRHTQELIMDALMEYVQNCGYEMDQATVKMRRPRTVFFSTELEEMKNRADNVWIVQNGVVEDGKNVEFHVGRTRKRRNSGTIHSHSHSHSHSHRTELERERTLLSQNGFSSPIKATSEAQQSPSRVDNRSPSPSHVQRSPGSMGNGSPSPTNVSEWVRQGPSSPVSPPSNAGSPGASSTAPLEFSSIVKELKQLTDQNRQVAQLSPRSKLRELKKLSDLDRSYDDWKRTVAAQDHEWASMSQSRIKELKHQWDALGLKLNQGPSPNYRN